MLEKTHSLEQEKVTTSNKEKEKTGFNIKLQKG